LPQDARDPSAYALARHVAAHTPNEPIGCFIGIMVDVQAQTGGERNTLPDAESRAQLVEAISRKRCFTAPRLCR
jgi:hypothetical protein